MAEILGTSNRSRVADLNPNDGSIYTPAYAIYENENVTKVALFNYISDSTGASDYVASVSIGTAGSSANSSDATPSSVYVKSVANILSPPCTSADRPPRPLDIYMRRLYRRNTTSHGQVRHLAGTTTPTASRRVKKMSRPSVVQMGSAKSTYRHRVSPSSSSPTITTVKMVPA